MVLSWIQLGWIALSIFQIGITIHLLYLYKMDGDKRKLMFGIAFLIAIFTHLYAATGIHDTTNESLLFKNLYYWASLPILLAVFCAVHHTLLKLKQFTLFFHSFIGSVVFSLLFIMLLPFPAEGFISPVVIAVGVEILAVSLLLFLMRRGLTDLMFLLAFVCFMGAGISTAQGLEQYFQIFSFFIGYTFLLMIFVYPEPSGTEKRKGIADIFALQKRLSETAATLRMTEERYRDLFEHIHSGVAVYEPVDNGKDFIFKDFNSAAEKIDNINRDEVIEKRVTEVFPRVKEFGLFDAFREVWKTGIPKHHPVSFYSGERLRGWRKNNIYKLSTGEIVAVYDDVTKQKQDEIALKQAHHHLQELNEKLDKKVEQRTAEVQQLLKQKDEFVNQLGHDLKHPLGPLVNLIPILEKNDTNPRHEEIYKVLNRNVEHMKNLVTKTIQLAQLNTSSSKLNLENTNLLHELDKILEKNMFLLEEHNIKIVNNVGNDILVQADKLLIQELFDNLVNNAIKYSPKGGTITVDTKHGMNSVTVSVKDTGIGLTKDQIAQIFDEFYKADSSRHDFDSSGLGMTICKRIVEKHGGHIWAESEGIGKGSRLYFTLPSAPQQQTNKVGNKNDSYHEVKNKVDTLLME